METEKDHLRVDETESKAITAVGKKVLKGKISVSPIKVVTSNVTLEDVGKNNSTSSKKVETSDSLVKSKENSSSSRETESSDSPTKRNKDGPSSKKSGSAKTTVKSNKNCSPTEKSESVDFKAKRKENKSPMKKVETSNTTANGNKNSSPLIKEGASSLTASSQEKNDGTSDFMTESKVGGLSEAVSTQALSSPKTKKKPRKSRGSRVSLICEEAETVIPKRRKSERTYEGDKLFGCNHCPLAFSSKEARMEHERTHQEKPHECPYCEMRFLAVMSMNRHMRIHK